VAEFPQRGGEVTRVGASPDGRYVLFDQGKEIRLLSIESGQVEGVFRNASGTNNFSTLALFDPDGLTVLTNRADNRIQLWRAPTHESARAAELRQLVWASGAATSAAFSPDGTFCVTGMKDGHVLVWPMPERRRDPAGRAELVETPVKTRVKEVGKFIDSSNRQVSVWAEVENKDNRLVPGGTATMVVLPESK
jgi:WD40 repeat protein